MKLGVAATLMLASLGVASSAFAYRTAGDLSDFADTERVRWKENQIPYVLYKEGAPGVSFSDVETTAASMLGIWSSPNCTNASFEYDGESESVGTPDDELNTIQWVTEGWEDMGFDAQASGLTDIQYKRVKGGDWEIVEADLYVNATNFSWVLGGDPPEGSREIASVLLHESGHMLGLLHPCEVGGIDGAPDCDSTDEFDTTVMYPFYTAGIEDLSEDDTEGVCFLYPGEGCEETGCPDGMLCTDEGCAPDCFGEVCAEGETCTIEQGCIVPECDGDDCFAPETCKVQSDCGEHLQCRHGSCLRGEKPYGDPCTKAFECLGGACFDGFCSTPCVSDAECVELQNGTCIRDSSYGYCSPGAKTFGDGCAGGDECLGEKCVAPESSNAGRCSRSCGSGLVDCPHAWTCSQVDGESVCQPPVEDEGCGCRIGGSWHGDGSRGFLISLGLLLTVVGRRFQRRKP